MEQRETDPVILAVVMAPFIIIGMWILSFYVQAP